MPVNIHGKQYITVAERLAEAREAIKSINTEVIQNGGAVVIKATVVTDKGTFTGISSANPDKAIEKQSPYEVAETSAVGRALGFAGYGVVDSIASADEMAKAQTVTHPVANQTAKTTVTTGSTAPKCDIHDKFMKERTRKDGTTWFDHRWQDEQGEWNQCNGKPKMTDEEELSMDQAVEY